MRITEIQRRLDGSRLELSATVTGLPGSPAYQGAWIRLPAGVAPEDDPVSDGAAWLAVMLPASVALGQRLEIDAPVPARLVAGADKVMRVWSRWNRRLRPVEIRAAEQVSDERRPEGVASFYSGGVDSSYTVLKHIDDPRLRTPSHLILVHGFDYPANGPLREEISNRIGRIASELGTELIEVETNLRQLNDPFAPWGTLQHGPLLAGIGLAMGGSFGRILIPAGTTFDTNYNWSSHPFTDPLWSTEATTFVHDGCEANRIEKISWRIAGSDPVLAGLRVCFENPGNAYNCGRCGKCQRTMLALRLAGVEDRAPLFPGAPDPALLEAMDATASIASEAQTRNLIEELEQRDAMPEMSAALRRSLRRTPAQARRALGRRIAAPLRLARDRHIPWARSRR